MPDRLTQKASGAEHGWRVSWRVLVDFDGTVTLDDLTNAILDRFADSSWRAIEAEWECGLIGSRECMGRQVALIRAGMEELDAFVAAAPVDPHFVDLVAACRRCDIPVCIVSDGLDRVIGSVLRRIGLQDLPVHANHLAYVEDGRWQLIFPYARDDCAARMGTCKCRAATPSASGRTTSILIGDGRSDLCAAASADYVFAKKQLLALCRERGIAHRPFATFEDATMQIERLVDAESLTSGAPIGETTYA